MDAVVYAGWGYRGVTGVEKAGGDEDGDAGQKTGCKTSRAAGGRGRGGARRWRVRAWAPVCAHAKPGIRLLWRQDGHAQVSSGGYACLSQPVYLDLYSDGRLPWQPFLSAGAH